jgi:hypothetical protein
MTMIVPPSKSCWANCGPMSTAVPSFATIVLPPGRPQVVTVPDESLWVITSVSISPTDPMPETGRVVVYVSNLSADGTQGEQIAIAPLRVGAAEVVNVDFQINSASPLVFSTVGAELSVSVTGYTVTSDQ